MSTAALDAWIQAGSEVSYFMKSLISVINKYMREINSSLRVLN